MIGMIKVKLDLIFDLNHSLIALTGTNIYGYRGTIRASFAIGPFVHM